MTNPAQRPHSRLRLRLRLRGTVLLAIGAVATIAGELDAIAALVAVGVCALVLVGLAALAALAAGRRATGRITPWLTGVVQQVRPGSTVEVVIRVADADHERTTSARSGGGPRPSSSWFEIDDPSGRWFLYRRHGV
ncbi:MAG: hypothetical protein M0013_09265, partial [Actinomycetota bacterium]|nr:hypothetical protein [Actinomycetota bacterium]